MTIVRQLRQNIERYIHKSGKKKIIIVYGARQVGKTTLIKEILKKHPKKSEYFNCDFFDVQEIFSHQNVLKHDKIFRNLDLIALDEAQRIENIGLVLKILVDKYSHLQIIASGSSSFDLSNKINEPLTGRKIEFKLFPFSFQEVVNGRSILDYKQLMSDMLIYGSYPLVILNNIEDSELFLKELTNSYLFKDIFNFQELKKPEILLKLLRLLAFQIGSEVSYNELAQNLKVDQTVVQKYIHLLEEAFVIFRLSAFSKNLRKEISKSRKIYFYDLGVRNTLIQNFNPLELRNDIGALFENFCILERLKMLEYAQNSVNKYFWRTYDQKEVDYIEEKNTILNSFEFKWNEKAKVKQPKEFLATYPDNLFQVITPENFDEFLKAN